MKIIFKILLVIPVVALGQNHAKFNEVAKKTAFYNTYTSKSGHVISYKDSVQIGLPSGLEGFRFITYGGWEADNVLAGRKLPIKAIRSYKQRIFQNKIFLDVRPYGIFPVRIDYEMALASGEIIAPEKLAPSK